jgi:hypothetical protein
VAAAPEDVLRLGIRKWSNDFIEPWVAQVNHITDPSQIIELRARTGGWPRLLYRFAEHLRATSDFASALNHTSAELKQLLANADAPSLFVGKGEAAVKAFATFQQLRALWPNDRPDFTSDDIEEAAPVLGLHASELRAALNHAETLQLVERDAPLHYRWDPVFDQLLTRV